MMLYRKTVNLSVVAQDQALSTGSVIKGVCSTASTKRFRLRHQNVNDIQYT